MSRNNRVLIVPYDIEKILIGEKTQTRVPVHREDRQWRDFDISETEIRGVRRSDGSEWVDSKDPFIYRVGEVYTVMAGPSTPALWWKLSRVPGATYGKRITQEPIRWIPYNTLDGYDYEDVRRVDRRPELTRQGYQPLRVRITAIHREDVRKMSESDLENEGFYGSGATWAQWDFLHHWCRLYDPVFLKHFPRYQWGMVGMDASIYTRPYERYTAWALTFEIVDQFAALKNPHVQTFGEPQ